MTSLIESESNILDITNSNEVTINPEDIVKEVDEINNILNNITNINIDDEFTIMNDGVKYKLGND